MKFQSLTILVLLFSITCSSVSAQVAKLKRANAYFEELSYSDAIQLYLEVLDRRDVDQAKVNLAESYRKIGNLSEAEYWYGQSVRLPSSKPENKLFYAMALQSNGKCELAIKWFEEYTLENPDDLRGQLLKESCSNKILTSLSKSSETSYKISNLSDINTSFDDFGAVFYGQGIVYASEHDEGGAVRRIHTWTGNPFLELYYADVETRQQDSTMTFNYSEPSKYSQKLNTKFHDGPLCFSSDQKTVYFTRNNITGKDDDGIIRLKIYSAKYANGSWMDIQSMPFNSDEYSVAHPAVSPDGEMMIFSSDMPGGFGSMDLYIARFENGRWSPAINLNSYIPGINTEGEEIFPSLHKDGTLFFTSNGHTGLGGLDNLYVKRINKVWGPITNVGTPINSEADDFAMVMDDEKTFGFFSSNRSGGAGNDDIYSFYRLLLDVEIFVFDDVTGKPLEGAAVTQDCGNSLPMLTGSDGKIILEMPLNKECEFSAAADQYLSNTIITNTSNYRAGDRIFVQIPLSRPLEFELAGSIIDEKTKRPVKGAVLTLTNDCGDLVQSSKAEKGGNFNFDLESDCCYVLTSEKKGFITKATNVCTRGKDRSEDITSILEMVPIPKSTTSGGPIVSTTPTTTGTTVISSTPPTTTSSTIISTPPTNSTIITSSPTVISTPSSSSIIRNYPDGSGEMTYEYFDRLPIIYHDYDKANVKELDKNTLTQVLNVMNVHSNIVIEIASHTDARGDADYNLLLSKRRAREVMRFLVKAGIDKARIKSNGYGETQLVNSCFDDTECEEEEHQLNRRTEIRVVGRSYIK